MNAMQVQLLTQVLDEVRSLRDEIRTLDTKLTEHVHEEEEILERHTAEIVAIQAGFPKGDMHGHADYHQSIIDRNKWLTEVLKETAKHIIKYGLIGFIVWLLWTGLHDLIQAAAHRGQG